MVCLCNLKPRYHPDIKKKKKEGKLKKTIAFNTDFKTINIQ